MVERHPSVDPVHPGEILREDVLPALATSKTAVAEALEFKFRYNSCVVNGVDDHGRAVATLGATRGKQFTYRLPNRS